MDSKTFAMFLWNYWKNNMPCGDKWKKGLILNSICDKRKKKEAIDFNEVT